MQQWTMLPTLGSLMRQDRFVGSDCVCVRVCMLQVEPSLHTGVASCACQVGGRLLFMGSSIDSSLLLHLTDRQVGFPVTPAKFSVTKLQLAVAATCEPAILTHCPFHRHLSASPAF